MTVIEHQATACLLPPRWFPVQVPWGGILGPHGASVRVTLRWSADDPYAVTFEFRNGREPVPWVCDRWLLAAALIGPITHRDLMGTVGEGDVRMDAYADALILTLDSPDGRARFWFDPDPLTDFLRATYAACQPGQEQQLAEPDWALLLPEQSTGGEQS